MNVESLKDQLVEAAITYAKGCRTISAASVAENRTRIDEADPLKRLAAVAARADAEAELCRAEARVIELANQLMVDR